MKKKILVVEDNEENLYLATFLLEKGGYEVIAARDGLEAIEKAKAERPDLILMDIQLPEMNGYEAIRRIKDIAEISHIPIVAVTSYAMVGDREKALAAGCVGYIEKPFMSETFVSEIERYLEECSGGCPMKILIVDDREEDRYILEVLLRAHGYEVESAANGIEALEKVRRGKFDMIIADILMPGMDGFQLCREVKTDENLKDIAFVFYTATYTDPKDEEFALSLGAERFIVKPMEPDVFVGILKEIIKSHEMGTLAAPRSPVQEEAVYLKKYNERLIKKLEDKVLKLERLNDELRESEEKYRTLIDNANDAVALIEPTGYLKFVNPEFCRMSGYSMEEAKELHFSELIHPDDLAMVMENLKKMLAGEKVPRNYEFRVLTKSGETIHVELNSSTIEREGEIVEVLSIIRDISERKRTEEEKEKIQAQLLQAQKLEAIGILAGGVAHDFNNLLTLIQGHTELAMMRLDEDDPLYRDLKEIHRASVRAANLTRQLLLFSRRQPMEMVPLDLNKVVGDIIKMIRRLIGEDISVATDMEEGLWTIRADPGNIEQVIMNLMVNARDAMPEGGEIFVRTRNVHLSEDDCKAIIDAQPGNFVCLSVEDTGVGMDEGTVQRIFEPFFSTKGPGKGTGLGLSVVYGIVKQHGGWINVYSKPGQGTTFKIYLPAVPIEPEAMDEGPISLEKFRGRGERILLVEDDRAIRKMSARALQENGYVPFPAASAEEALEIFERENGNFALVFSDVVLPDKDGLQLIDDLLSRKPELRILLTSGYSDRRSRWWAAQEKGLRFIQKPYSLPDLLRTIKEVLETGE